MNDQIRTLINEANATGSAVVLIFPPSALNSLFETKPAAKAEVDAGQKPPATETSDYSARSEAMKKYWADKKAAAAKAKRSAAIKAGWARRKARLG